MTGECAIVIEDDAAIREILVLTLQKDGFSSVKTAETGEAGWALVQNTRPDLVLLDLMLPGLDGYAVCRRIRAHEALASTPIIMLTAKSAEQDIVRGLACGADDYVTKPFSRAVLTARIHAVLRRPVTAMPRCMDGLVLDEDRHRAELDGRVLSLTPSEFAILVLLVNRSGRVWTRTQILDRIQRGEKAVTERTVDVQMVSLRRKLGAWADHVETIRGIGYRLKR